MNRLTLGLAFAPLLLVTACSGSAADAPPACPDGCSAADTGAGRDASTPADGAPVADGGAESAPGPDAPTTETHGDAAIPTDGKGTQAARAQQLLDGIGVNTHVDFTGYQRIGLPAIEKAIDYVGAGKLALLRDSPGNDQDLVDWAKITAATGAKFVAFINEGDPSVYADHLGRMRRMHAAGGYLFAYEGGNEEDDAYPVGLGNSAAQAAAFQSKVFAAGVADKAPVFQISFGAGWDKPTGDYGTVGDLSAVADYANAHTYPQASPHHDVGALADDAHLATPGKPVAHTEFGWNTFDGAPTAGWGWCSQATCAAYDIEFILDAFAAGAPYYFRYELFDDRYLESANGWGLFADDGTPRASATAMRVLFQLLSDPGGAARTFAPGKLDFTIAGMPGIVGDHGGRQALFQTSDGTFHLALWNEQALNDPSANNADLTVAAVPVTLTLTTEATRIDVLDVLAGSTTPVKSATAAKSLSFELPAHPLLVRIVRP